MEGADGLLDYSSLILANFATFLHFRLGGDESSKVGERASREHCRAQVNKPRLPNRSRARASGRQFAASALAAAREQRVAIQLHMLPRPIPLR
jgi:hypothetical protein